LKASALAAINTFKAEQVQEPIQSDSLTVNFGHKEKRAENDKK